MHEKAIKKLKQEYDDNELKIADAYIELNEPIRAKLEHYEAIRASAMIKRANPTKGSAQI
ncbi:MULTISPECIES: hypothetical protein [unclassified Nostoc]|uniref:hypothetical protein n=1 Tax=unclassified Nostoc TaxID=2593658 RepID=UPI002AD3ED21|nr:hypothetical protein [Nostoc sp. DedQUE03]MDZ7977555.1 hypothetical protein [Nostoc sp. DedQUE03]MDZ8049327.1 hypothetical protein [Nostoc sp. DedQUE02]